MEQSLVFYAREMLTKTETISITTTGDIERSIAYNSPWVPNEFFPDSCLNVYGLRMVLEAQSNLIRDPESGRKDELEKKEIKTYGGFNYTGL